MSDEFAGAAVRLQAGTNLCRPFLAALPITGASVSTLAAPFGTETVCASDAQAARLDELQIDLGEGPCWDALSTRRPVLASDMQSPSHQEWPLFSKSLVGEGVGALFAFPLMVGTLGIGAVDLYSRVPGDLTASQVTGAMSLAGVAARQVLRMALSTLAEETAGAEAEEGRYSRRIVHQATGIVLAQLDVSAEDAMLIIRAHAYASGRTVREISRDITERRLDLSAETPEI
jgi:hypothetical protein